MTEWEHMHRTDDFEGCVLIFSVYEEPSNQTSSNLHGDILTIHWADSSWLEKKKCSLSGGMGPQ
jgi:hypothetical protein